MTEKIVRSKKLPGIFGFSGILLAKIQKLNKINLSSYYLLRIFKIIKTGQLLVTLLIETWRQKYSKHWSHLPLLIRVYKVFSSTLKTNHKNRSLSLENNFTFVCFKYWSANFRTWNNHNSFIIDWYIFIQFSG